MKETFSLWFKVVVACIPGAIVTLLFDDYITAHFETPYVIAGALIFYGIVFIIVERWNKTRTPKVEKLEDITYKTASFPGVIHCTGYIPLRFDDHRSTPDRCIPCSSC